MYRKHMNRMQYESIKHEEALKAAQGTHINWIDLLDNTQECERETNGMTEEQMHKYWKAYFTDVVAEIIWEDSQEKAE